MTSNSVFELSSFTLKTSSWAIRPSPMTNDVPRMTTSSGRTAPLPE